MHHIFNICGGITSFCQEAWYFLKISNGLNIVGTLFLTERAIEIGADANVQRIAGQLADVIQVIY